MEGEIEEYGQKNISSIKRNLLNADEILRIPQTKLLVNLKGNKPLILDKVIYTEHPLAKQLKDSSILDYNPTWQKNNSTIIKKVEEQPATTNEKQEKTKTRRLTWEEI